MYILVYFLLTSSSGWSDVPPAVATSTQEFASQSTCEAAKKFLLEGWDEKKEHHNGGVVVRAECFPQ
jgi:hypothetical protein